MAGPLIPDALWEIIEPLLPTEPPKPKGGRPHVPARQALGGILFVLRSGIPWQMLPREMGWGSGMTCGRRLRDWQAAGVWERLDCELLNRLHDAGWIDWSRPSLDSASVAASTEGGTRVRAPPTAESPERSATSLWMGLEFRLRCGSRPAMCTTAGSSSRSSTPFRRYGDAEPADRGADLTRCTRTRPTTSNDAAGSCADEGSVAGSPARESSPARAWGDIVGWSSARWPRSGSSAEFRSAMSVWPTYILRCLLSRVA